MEDMMGRDMPQAPPDAREEQRWVMGNLRRRYSRIAWAILLFLVLDQLLGGLVYLIPGLDSRPLLQELAVYIGGYGPAILAMWLVLRPLPKGRCPNLTISPKAFVRTAVFSVGMIYLFSQLTDWIIWGLEWITGLETSDLLQTAAEDMPAPVFILVTSILAPVVEELVFRGILLERLRPFGDMAAILISGFAFGLFHMNLYQFFYATALGLVFAGVVLKTGRLWHSMLLHAIVNTTTSVISYLSELSDPMNIAMTVVYYALMLLAVVILVRYARSYRFAPPQYPATQRQAVQGILRSVGMWVCFAVAFALSVAIIFLY